MDIFRCNSPISPTSPLAIATTTDSLCRHPLQLHQRHFRGTFLGSNVIQYHPLPFSFTFMKPIFVHYCHETIVDVIQYQLIHQATVRRHLFSLVLFGFKGMHQDCFVGQSGVIKVTGVHCFQIGRRKHVKMTIVVTV